MLRTLTGQTTQQHLQNKIIEKAKILLSTTNLPISEIAYSLGFEYPQSFQRLFKDLIDISPLKF
ncbi:helix-turn-helix domain-containing protein [Sphingobacterium sp. WOUb80]|uniref:helix-turn-helix domain-containing protein n=1 Tax=Sphingobacterium sp. WOUb80 TaxID=3234028 RepID=UPI003CE87045